MGFNSGFKGLNRKKN